MENCFICCKTLSEGEVIKVKEKRIQTLIKASIMREEKEHERMLTPLTSLRVHRKCQLKYADERAARAAVRRKLLLKFPPKKYQQKYADKRTAGAAVRRKLPSKSQSTPSSASQNTEFDLKKCCLICGEIIPVNLEEINKKLKYNKRVQVHTVKYFSKIKTTVMSRTMDRSDEFSRSVIARIKDVPDAAGIGARYHRKCMLRLLNPPKKGLKRGRPRENIDELVDAIYNYLKAKDDDSQFKLSDIIEEMNCDEVADVRTIISNLYDKYRDNITMYRKRGTGTIICLKNTSDKILADSYYKAKEANSEDERLHLIQETSSTILEDIRNLLLEHENPPINNDMENVDSMIPESLKTFLHELISKNKRSKTGRWQNICTAIANTIITAVHTNNEQDPMGPCTREEMDDIYMHESFVDFLTNKYVVEFQS